MDLLSLTLTLRSLPQANPTQPLPLWWGRTAHALLLNTVRQYDPALAESLHESPAPKPAGERDEDTSSLTLRPFTVSSLIGRFPYGALDPAQTYSLRLTALQGDLAGLLQRAAQDGPLAPGQEVELDHMLFRVEEAQAETQTYTELSAALMLAKQPAARRIRLEFLSPTTFKSGGKHMPVPLPELVFGSLLERWNAFAPITFPPEARRYAAEVLAITRYKLATRSIPVKRGGLRMGAVGEASYTSLSYDRYWMSVLGVLAAFAHFSGVGAGTGMGLGQCCSLEAGEPGEAER